ncbi:MAG: hypothetical protein C0511_13755 [Hyphomicrobium sp.]|nr:hypothetical protein [Hyphomicrobium sp.]
MAEGSTITQVVVDDSAVITVVRGRIRVKFNANGGIDVYGYAPVTLHAPVNDIARLQQVMTEPQVGDRMEDGTIFGGISPDTNKPMYVRPVDESLTMKWKQAMDYAVGFEGHGKPVGTFRVPTDRELNMLFQNRAKIGGFNVSRSYPAEWYWSSSPYDYDNRKVQSFYDGFQDRNCKVNHSSVRLVRS